MTAPVIPNSGGGLTDLAQFIKTLSPEFGSGKTKETQTQSADAGSNEQANALLQQIAGSTNPQDIDNMIQNILVRAKQAFGPAAIGSNAAGIRAYSDTTENSLRNEAVARATGEAAAAKLNAINTANATSAKVVESKMQANRQVQSEKKTGVTPTGMGLLLSLGAGSLAKRLPKGIFGEDKTTGTGISNPSYVAGEFGPENVANFPGDVGQDTNVINSDATPIDSNFVGDLPLAFDNPDIPDSSQVGAFDTGSAAGDIASGAGDEITNAAIAADAGIESGGGDVLTDLFSGFFADGGEVTGRRAPPGAYAPGVLNNNQNLNPSSTLASPIAVLTPPRGAANKKSIVVDEQGNIINENSAGMADANSTNNGMSFGAFSPSPTAVAVAAANVAAGNFAGAAMALTVSAFANAVSNQTVTDSDPAETAGLGVNIAGMTPASTTAPTAVTAEGFDAAMTAADADAVTAPSDTTAPSGGEAPAGGESAPGGGDTGASDSGSGDGGPAAEAEGGVIEGDKPSDYSGIDKVLIRVTPGEAVLPEDTVQALGGIEAIEDLIKKTHRPIRRRR